MPHLTSTSSRLFPRAIAKAALVGASAIAFAGAGIAPVAAQSLEFLPQPQKQNAEVSPADLESFARAIASMRDIVIESRQDITSAIQEEGLTVRQYQEILQAQQEGQTADIPQEDLEKFNRVGARLETIDRETQTELVSAVEAEMSPKRYQEILRAVNQNPALQQRVRQMIGESNQNQPTP